METEFQKKYGNTGSQFDQRTAPMDHQHMGGRQCTTSLEGCKHSHHLQKGSYLTDSQATYYPRGDARDAVRLSFKPKHSRHDFLSTTTSGKVPRAGYIVFVDFTKAFDTVGRTGLWQLLRKYGCPKKFTTMIASLHTGMMVNVRNGGGLGYICKRCQAGVRTGTHTFLHLSVRML